MKSIEGKKENTIIQPMCILFLFMILWGFAYNLMGTDMIPLMKWWGILFVTGIVFYPLTACLFRRFEDNGYLF